MTTLHRAADRSSVNPCVLALDDESAVLGTIQETLGKAGYTVITARSMAQFRKLNAEHEVDLYLIDISLPDGNGLSLVRELRREADQGIILLAARGRLGDDVLGLEIGADDYVGKPLESRELTARVNAVFRRTGARREARPSTPHPARAHPIDHEFEGYKLSLKARQLWAPDGREIDLTTSEFELLTALITRSGQVLSRDQIMNAIKGRQWEAYDRVVDGIVSRLRRKIPGPNRSRHFIRTVHGVGYAFTA